MDFSLEEILIATSAKILKNEGVNGLTFTFSTDTRTIKPGEIYLPLKGENFDGEKFIDKALENGAVGYFTTTKETVSRKQETGNKETHFSPLTSHSSKLVLLVEDTLTTYLQLAHFYRDKINPKTIAITGSSGKTTTKEMAYCVASEKFKTHKSELNFNNEIGLCKSILAMPKDTEVLILEMGMRGLGEIELLSKYSEPDISIIANVGSAHIGRLGSRENIAKAKCEVTKHQKEDGTLIAHDDDLIKKYNTFKGETVYFSLDDATFLEKKIEYSKFSYKNHEYELHIEGDYNIQNALAVIELGLKLKIAPDEIRAGLKKYSPIEKRWEIQEVKGFKIINDSYNANPESVKAALKTFLELYAPPLLIVVGDMAELGEHETKYHQEIGEFLYDELKGRQNVKTITIGSLAKKIAETLNNKGVFAESLKDNTDAARYIVDNLEIGTTIILKASRSMKFEEIIERVKNER